MIKMTSRRLWLIIALVVVFILLIVAFSAQIVDLKSLLKRDPASLNQMEESPFALCDLNKDWACDEADEQILNDAFGKCRGEPGYNFEADVDGDGCVVTNDRQIFSMK